VSARFARLGLKGDDVHVGGDCNINGVLADLARLDGAKGLGMKTALFDTGDLDLPAVVGHPIVTSFKGLVGSK
jgi:hypothetical protein